jgi:hypothetical protein
MVQTYFHIYHISTLTSTFFSNICVKSLTLPASARRVFLFYKLPASAEYYLLSTYCILSAGYFPSDP